MGVPGSNGASVNSMWSLYNNNGVVVNQPAVSHLPVAAHHASSAYHHGHGHHLAALNPFAAAAAAAAVAAQSQNCSSSSASSTSSSSALALSRCVSGLSQLRLVEFSGFVEKRRDPEIVRIILIFIQINKKS